MQLKKVICSLFSLLLCICISYTSTYANDAINANDGLITLGVQELEEGNVIEIVLNLNSENSGSKAIIATLQYDENLFEPVTVQDIRLQNKWEELQFNPQTKELVAINRTSALFEEEVVRVRLRLKQEINEVNKTKVGFTDIQTSRNGLDQPNLDIVQEIQVVPNQGSTTQPSTPTKPDVTPVQPTKPEVVPGGEPSNPNGTGGLIGGNRPTIENTTEKPATEKPSSAGTTITVNTGIESNIVIVLLFLSSCVVLVLLLNSKKFGHLKNYKWVKRLFLCYIVCFVSLGALKVFAVQEKGDINGDYSITHDDLRLLQRHLIHIEELDESKHEYADMNSDEKLTVTDLEMLVEKVESQIDYEITLTSAMEQLVFEKNQTLQFVFQVTMNHAADIQSVVIAENEVPVQKLADDKYQINITMHDVVEPYVVKITDVILINGKKVNVKFQQELHVKKQPVSLQNSTIDSNVSKKQFVFNYTLLDPDQSLVNSKLILKRESGELVKEIDLHAVLEGSATLNVELNQKYLLQLIVTSYTDTQNQLTEETILLEQPIELLQDANVTMTSYQLTNGEGTEVEFVNKNDTLKAVFEVTNTTEYPVRKVVMNGNEYEVVQEENQTYSFQFNASENAGNMNVSISAVILENGMRFDVNNEKQIFVLKSKPQASDLQYDKTDDGKIRFTLTITDADHAITEGYIQILNGEQEIAKFSNIQQGQNTFEFNANRERYNLRLVVSYDLDNDPQNQKNQFTNEQLFQSEIKITEELFELKDIKEVEVYTKDGDTVKVVDQIDTRNFQPDNYLVRVNMEDTAPVYAKVESGTVENENFYLTLSLNNYVQYVNNEKKYGVKVKFGSVNNHMAENITFQTLIEKIKANNQADIKLSHDLDANDVNVSTATYLENFQGTLDGNGFTIKNLRKPLFANVNSGTVKNLILKDANVRNNNRGILANALNGATITNVHIIDSNIDAVHQQGLGALSGIAEGSTTITECSVTNTRVNGGKRVGGFLGYIKANASISDCYIKDSTVTSQNDAVGGVVGEHPNGDSTINNVYVSINFQPTPSHASGGILGYSGSQKVKLSNVLSLAKGERGAKISGTNYNGASTNVYEIEESTLSSSAGKPGVKSISENDLNKGFFKDTLGWDESIWNLEGVNKDNLPTLKKFNPTKEETISQPTNENIYIPEFDRLSKLDEFDSTREIAYYNTYQLMPFYDGNLIIDYGNRIATTSRLNQQRIRYIFAYNQEGKVVTGVNRLNYNQLASIKIVYENQEAESYPITFYTDKGNIAAYKINDLNLLYTFNNYIMNQEDTMISQLLSEMQAFSYEDVKTIAAGSGDSRLYPEHYNNVVKPNLNQMIISLLQSQPAYNIYMDSDILRSKIMQDIKKDDLLKTILFAYNYYDRWYNFEISGLSMRDFIFFMGNSYEKGMDVTKLADLVKHTHKRASHQTHEFYNNSLKHLLENRTMKEFIDSMILSLTDYDSANDWFTDNFRGLIYEARPYEEFVDYGYRAWEIINRKAHWILPVLTLPTEDMYLVTTVGHIYTGSMNLYNAYKIQEGETDKTQAKKRMMDKMISYGDKFAKYYSMMLTTVPNPESMRNGSMTNYDSKYFNYGDETSPLQIGRTHEPVLKNFTNAVNANWNDANGVAAYANGYDVFWVKHHQLDDYRTATHEAVHNEDSYFLFGGNGRRAGSGAEWYTNNVNTQEFSGERTVYNFTYEFDPSEEISVNFKTKSVYGKEKLHSYYNNMFETLYVLDYLQGKAFLDLTPEEQSFIAQQFNWEGLATTDKIPNDDGVQNGKGRLYNVSAEDFKRMNLQTLEDLYDYRIVLNRNNNGTPASIYHTYWYMPHNNTGVGDENAYYYISKEMLGYAGWENGYVAYASNKHKQDLAALKAITGKNSFKEYKNYRYQQVEQRLSSIPYFDSAQIIEEFKQAYKQDAMDNSHSNTRSKNIRRLLYNNIKRITQDFSQSIYSPATKISVGNANQLKQAVESNPMAYIHLTNDIDMSSLNNQEGDTYFDMIFVGRIDGNGHKLTNVKKALFKELRFADINNITIEHPVYVETVNGSLANVKALVSKIKNITVTESNINLPYSDKSDTVFLDNYSVTVASTELRTIEDIKALKADNSDAARKKSYKLMADIDVSSIREDHAIITGEFRGIFDGNGHKLTNASRAIFGQLRGTVKNLIVENSKIGSKWGEKDWGILARSCEDSIFENIMIKNSKIDGYEHTGGLVGKSTRSKFNKIQLINTNVYGPWFYVGGMIGRSYDSQIQDVILSGDSCSKETHSGGLIGGSNRDIVDRVYSKMMFKKLNGHDGRNKVGGLYGHIEGKPTRMSNAVILANFIGNVHKVATVQSEDDINTAKATLNNVYEASFTTGISTSERIPEVVKKVDEQTSKTKSFYTNTLNFPEEIWDFNGIENGEMPTFKNSVSNPSN